MAKEVRLYADKGQGTFTVLPPEGHELTVAQVILRLRQRHDPGIGDIDEMEADGGTEWCVMLNRIAGKGNMEDILRSIARSLPKGFELSYHTDPDPQSPKVDEAAWIDFLFGKRR
jgi:hypothetical protein